MDTLGDITVAAKWCQKGNKDALSRTLENLMCHKIITLDTKIWKKTKFRKYILKQQLRPLAESWAVSSGPMLYMYMCALASNHFVYEEILTLNYSLWLSINNMHCICTGPRIFKVIVIVSDGEGDCPSQTGLQQSN